VLGWAVGLPVLTVGLIFVGYGVAALGKSLSPFPRPTTEGTLVTEGIYGCVRHPIYGGLSMAALGFALLSGSLGRVLMALALFGFFAAKSGVEEAWLVERYPDYPSYQARVRRMLPGIW
jgi:protein-S-isoprenylcysteine O-methyltransferase Ste14